MKQLELKGQIGLRAEARTGMQQQLLLEQILQAANKPALGKEKKSHSLSAPSTF